MSSQLRASSVIWPLTLSLIHIWTTQSVASAFGLERYHNAVAGSDGLKYYVSMQNEAGEWSLFVYDTRLGIWEREDDTQALGFAWDSDLYFLDADGTLWLNGRPRFIPEGATIESPVESMVCLLYTSRCV